MQLNSGNEAAYSSAGKALEYSEAYAGRDSKSSETMRRKPLSPPGIICPRANMIANLQNSNLTT